VKNFAAIAKKKQFIEFSGDLEGKIPMEARLLRELLLGA